MTAAFAPEGGETHVDETKMAYNKARLKMAKQTLKITQFQLGQAENSGDQKAVEELKAKVKETEKEIRIAQDDVDSALGD